MSRRTRRKKSLLLVFGTRPEAIKLLPVVREAKKQKRFKVFTCLTGQHREMVDQVLKLFNLRTDFDLNLMEKGQTLSDLTSRLFPKLQRVFERTKPDLVILQGDTTTAFAVALQAFYSKIAVAHVEAGLRSRQKYYPFPEEINRVLISHLTDWHFAPTKEAKDNLLREGIAGEKIFVTGNTIVDALQQARILIRPQNYPSLRGIRRGRRYILVTAHRRESFGRPLQSICLALKDIVAEYPDAEIVFPVHLNPKVQQTVRQYLDSVPRVRLLHPLGYGEFLAWMRQAVLILSDSGGVQEEAASFQKPVLIMRSVTERMEGVRRGMAKLVGTDRRRIVRESRRLLKRPEPFGTGKKIINPYGDGKASKRIIRCLLEKL